MYILEILFFIIITIVKGSILFFYRTIFATPQFGRVTSAVGGLCLIWFTVFIFITIFQCHPVRAAWDELLAAEGKGHCILAGTYIFGYDLRMCASPLAYFVFQYI